MIDALDNYTRIILAAIGILAAVVGWLGWVRPRWRAFWAKVTAAFDALIGRPAIHDSITGKEISPALPGIGSRMATQEAQMQIMATAVARLAESHERLNDHEVRITATEDRIDALEVGATERVVNRVDSIAAWEAVRAAAEAQPESPPEALDE